MFVMFIREHITKDSFKLLVRLIFAGVILALALGFRYLTITVNYYQIKTKFLRRKLNGVEEVWLYWIPHMPRSSFPLLLQFLNIKQQLGHHSSLISTSSSSSPPLVSTIASENQPKLSFSVQFILSFLSTLLVNLLLCANHINPIRCHGSFTVGLGSCCMYHGWYWSFWAHQILYQIFEKKSIRTY